MLQSDRTARNLVVSFLSQLNYTFFLKEAVFFYITCLFSNLQVYLELNTHKIDVHDNIEKTKGEKELARKKCK